MLNYKGRGMPSVASLATRFEGNFKVGQPLRLRIPKHVSI